MKTIDSIGIVLTGPKTLIIQTFLPLTEVFLIVFLFLVMVPYSQTQASDLGLTEADCRCCHGPTLADRHHLMVINRGLECLGCHQMSWNATAQQYDMVVVRDCPQCHIGSLADRHHLLVDQVTYNCFTCHTIALDPDTLMYVTDFNRMCDASPPHSNTQSATINGTVSDTSGNGLGWVQVTADNGSYSTLTTSSGAFQFADFAPGNHVLTASADGYITTSQSIDVVENQTQSVAITLSPLTITPTVNGRVLDARESPIEGASILSDNGSFTAISDVEGSFTLTDVPVGNLTLTAEKAGYGSNTQSITVSSEQIPTIEFILPDFPMENCNDGMDNDGNGFTDCTDSACDNTAACLPPVEVCADGIDNNTNGLLDCGDPTCMGTINCPLPTIEICDDSIDNNGDDLADCADPTCSASVSCLSENCSDDIDNNGDGLIDCTDPVCSNTSKCLSPPVEICSDGIDNDSNGRLDCDDEKCLSQSICAQPGEEENQKISSCEYIVQSEWGTGFSAVIRIHNNSAAPVNGWEVNWEYTDNTTISNNWNANLSGANPYVAGSLNWNAIIYPGQRVELGILGQKIPPAAQVPIITGSQCDAGELRCEYVVLNEWENGFEAVVRLHNDGTEPISGWEVDWTYTDDSVINHFWNANLSGSNPFKATNLSWNKTIYPGNSIEFGLLGQKNTLPAQVPAVSGVICGDKI